MGVLAGVDIQNLTGGFIAEAADGFVAVLSASE